MIPDLPGHLIQTGPRPQEFPFDELGHDDPVDTLHPDSLDGRDQGESLPVGTDP